MAITISSTKTSESIAALLRLTYQQDGDTHKFTVRGSDPEITATLPESWFGETAARLAGNVQAKGDAALFSPRHYEALVSEESRFGLGRLHGEDNILTLTDNENGITYKLGPPSVDFLVFFLNRLADVAPKAAIRSSIGQYRLRRHIEQGTVANDVIEWVRITSPRLLTCQVETKQNRNSDDLASHANAFLFHLTYNMNVALVEMQSLDDFVRSSRLASMRRSRASELEPPKRTYIKELTYHYQLGVSAESPVLEFLSYYHVAEYFFEAVFHDDLVEAIRERLTRPDFSTKRKKDVQGLVREINKRQRIRDETITFSEQEALRLTLAKYVPLDNLCAKLTAYDKKAVGYFKSTPVTFSSGDAVDIEAKDSKTVFGPLAQRLYRTRNAIVHSKDGDRGRFVPFDHDPILAKEVPLIRFIAEEIIIASSTSV
jgi:hypothetical protein